MDFVHENLYELKKRLLKESMFNRLSYDVQENLIKNIVDRVQEYSKDFETRIIVTGREGIKCEITYDENIKMQAKYYYNVENKYTGKITISRMMICAMYEFFYGIDYSNIVSDGKNIDNIKLLSFLTAFEILTNHEMCHIYRGHLQYKDNFNEFEKENEDIIIKCLEYDADSYTATQFFYSIMRMNKELSLPMDFCLNIYTCALHGALYWMDQTLDKQKITQHFSIRVREGIMENVIADLALRDSHFQNYKEQSRIYQVDKLIEEYDKCFDSFFNISKKEIEMEIPVEKAIRKMNKVWKRIVYERLNNYSIIPLIDPVN